MKKMLLASAAIFAATAFSAPASAATCLGNCGNLGPDGSVTVAPTGDGSYDYVSTFQGQDGVARIDGFSDGATNGSELLSDAFFATSGQKVEFFFNYVTSDGSGFADYAFAQLLDANTGAVTANLFTARTKPSGTIVPGQELPGVEAELSPASVPIIPGAPTWSPLGFSSGSCFAAGCGYTGWIESTYEIVNSGSYQLRFGAANVLDTSFDTGLAFSGLVLDGSVIGDGSSFDNPLLPGEIGPNGAFEFEFVASPNEFVFIDPDVTTGYDYIVNSGPNILSAMFPNIGDVDGYDIFLLSDLLNPIATSVPAGAFNFFDFGFTDGVTGFALRDIETGLAIDPTNTTAFITGLKFNVPAGTTAAVDISQIPVTTFVPGGAVPEPATWALMIAGFGMVGGSMRYRRRRTSVSFG